MGFESNFLAVGFQLGGAESELMLQILGSYFKKPERGPCAIIAGLKLWCQDLELNLK